MKKIILVLRAGLQETFTDKKIIVLLLIIGFIIDNGVRRMVNHALQVRQPLGVFEGAGVVSDPHGNDHSFLFHLE